MRRAKNIDVRRARRVPAWQFIVLAALLVTLLGPSSTAFADEHVAIDAIRKPVVIARDSDGIVHIYAASEEDLAFGQGWAHARDRLFQMDLQRRQASGTLTELFGPSMLAEDQAVRTLGLRRAAACSLRSTAAGCPRQTEAGMTRETITVLEAYARGVNAYVIRHGLPPEYTRPPGFPAFSAWTALDSVTVAKALGFALAFDTDDLENTQALAAYVAAAGRHPQSFDPTALFFEDVFRVAPFEPVAVIPSGAVTIDAAQAQVTTGEAATREAAADLGGRADLARRALQRLHHLAILRGGPGALRTPGGAGGASNAWAVSAGRTAGLGPLLANDPHLDLTTPPLFYPIHLSAPLDGIDMFGDSFAGVPFIAAGRNTRVGCGLTAIGLDVTDYFAETIVPDPQAPAGLRIKHDPPDDALDRIVRVNEEFRDQAGAIIARGASLLVPRRDYGPLLDDSHDGVALSVQYTGFAATRELDAFRLLMRARDLNDVAAAMRLFDTGSQSFTCADVGGRIGTFVGGVVPLREDLQRGTVIGLPPFFVRNGTGGNDWLRASGLTGGKALPFEVLPSEEMPQVINPPEGYLVNANNDPLGLTFDNDPLNSRRPDGGIYYLAWRFHAGLRAYRISELLDQRLKSGPVTFEDMRRIQADVVLHDAAFFLPYLVRAFDAAGGSGNATLIGIARDPAITEAIGRLRVWDRSTPTGIAEGYDASENGRRLPPTPDERAASVAATIYSVWRGQFIRATVIATLDRVGVGRFASSSQQLVTATRTLLEHDGVGASGLDFFAVPGEETASRAVRRDILLLGSLKSALSLLKGETFAPVFGRSFRQADYRWGRLHRVVIDHPLGDAFSLTGARDGNPFRPPLANLPGLPMDGGFETVDAANHSSRADTPDDFVFRQGPLRRFVTALSPFGRSESSLPGGVSGDKTSRYFNNLLGHWLTNETYPWRRLPLCGLRSNEVVVLVPRHSSR